MGVEGKRGGAGIEEYHAARILKVSMEGLTGLSHTYHPDGLNNTVLSQGCVLETAGRMCIPRTGEGKGNFHFPGSNSRVNQ